MMHELKRYLNKEYNIYWHCINASTDLDIILVYLNPFINFCIVLNVSSVVGLEIESQKSFNKWLNNMSEILSKIILETDFPFFKPTELQQEKYHIKNEIIYTAEHIVNVIRKKKINLIKFIDGSNKNVRLMYKIN